MQEYYITESSKFKALEQIADLFESSTVYIEPTNERTKLIAEYVQRGLSIIPLNDEKKPLIDSWKQYQTRQPKPKKILKWLLDFPNFNVGIITGFGGFYSLDFDSLEAFKNFPDEYKNTALTQTRRGMHLNFYSGKKYAGKILKINGFKVEFKGLGQYVVEPPAIIDGFEYKIINPLSQIKTLPSFVTDLLEKEEEKEKKKTSTNESQAQINWEYKGTQACIRQILDRELVVGERDESLFILYNLLAKSNDEKYAQHIVRKKNDLLKQPLPEKEILNIFNEKLYTFMGCDFVKRNLPWIKCEGCRWQREAIESVDFYKVLFSKKLKERDKQVYYKLVIEKADNKEAIARELGVGRREIYRSIERLKKEGFL